MIAFVGSVFSPYYAWDRWRDPVNHCALNIALYGGAASRWAMTERGRAAVDRSASHLRIGPSALHWQAGSLEIEVDEVTAPIPRRIRGRIRVTPMGLPTRAFALDAAGRHIWQPIAPRARLEVVLDQPRIRWEGDAYLDSNYGSEPLQDGFSRWTWSRAHRAGECLVLYDADRRDGAATSLAIRFGDDGGAALLDPPPLARLPRTGWRLARQSRGDAGASVRVRQTLEDTPFYARSILDTRLYGEPMVALHEALSLDRLRSPLVRAMLPFRMPRRRR